MSEDDLPTQYYTEVGRQESFEKKHPIAKRRGSNAGGRGAKTAKWPHEWLEPRSLAEAGFIYNPEPGNLDNVMCFLCRRSICGWTDGDNPLEEHLKLSPDCGWAITACIEAKVGGVHLENPTSTRMVEARKATFGDRWPHDAKKGWKCKTKQLVEAGWIYKPTFDGDDFAECIYCTLALDGWEPGDKPFHEHHVRSPECAFFELSKEADSPMAKKAAKSKGRKARASNASKASTSSQQRTASQRPKDQDSDNEAVAIVDSINQTIVAEDDSEDDDDHTAATESSKMLRASGSRTASGRVTKKAVKATGKESRRIQTDEDTIMHGNHKDIEDTVIVKPPKPPRGKKRGSDELIPAMPPPSKRLTRKSVALNQSVMTEAFTMGNSSSVQASTPKESPKVATSLSNTLFDERVVDDAAIEAELEAMAQEEAKQVKLKMAKVTHKDSAKDKSAASRAAREAKEAQEADQKASVYQKQKKEREAAEAIASKIEQEAEEKRIRILIEAEAERLKLEDEAFARAEFVRAEKEEAERKRLAAREEAERKRQQEEEAKQRRAQAVEDAKQKKLEAEKAAQKWKLYEEKQAAKKLAQEKKRQADVEEKEAAKELEREKKHQAEIEEKQAAMKLARNKQREAEAAANAELKRTAARSSDEENHPPTSKAPQTPSRHDGKAGLQTSRRWIAVDVDNVFDHLKASPQEQDQNVHAITPMKDARVIMKTGKLSATERAMTVDDWIKYNALLTQEVLQSECQKMVREFDMHGVRARNALAGIGIVDS